jgi:hypothetical protein
VTDLSVWKTRPAPDDFADRVMARIPMRRARWPWIAAVAAAVLVALFFGLRAPSDGRFDGEARTTLALADRAVVVAEAGARLRWRVEPSGQTHVQQGRGAAFYRVEPGGVFTVSTPYGGIDVRGTCFSVEVNDMGAMKTAATSAALSAAMTGAVLVTVYEGRVALGSDVTSAKAIEVAAGERAYATPGQAPRLVAQGSVQGASTAPAVPPELLAARTQIAWLEAELTRTQKEIEQLRKQAPATEKATPGMPAARDNFRPSPTELVDMAKSCEIRVDLPGGMFNRAAPTIRRDYGLNDEDARAAQRALSAMHDQTLKELREIYVLSTGDAEAAKWLSPSAMLQELEDKTADGVQALARKRISAERAGLAPSPTDLSQVPPGERFVRWFNGLPDALEATVAKELGPERAKELRDRFGGWQGSRWSRSGCPK